MDGVKSRDFLNTAGRGPGPRVPDSRPNKPTVVRDQADFSALHPGPPLLPKTRPTLSPPAQSVAESAKTAPQFQETKSPTTTQEASKKNEAAAKKISDTWRDKKTSESKALELRKSVRKLEILEKSVQESEKSLLSNGENLEQALVNLREAEEKNPEAKKALVDIKKAREFAPKALERQRRSSDFERLKADQNMDTLPEFARNALIRRAVDGLSLADTQKQAKQFAEILSVLEAVDPQAGDRVLRLAINGVSHDELQKLISKFNISKPEFENSLKALEKKTRAQAVETGREVRKSVIKTEQLESEFKKGLGNFTAENGAPLDEAQRIALSKVLARQILDIRDNPDKYQLNEDKGQFGLKIRAGKKYQFSEFNTPQLGEHEKKVSYQGKKEVKLPCDVWISRKPDGNLDIELHGRQLGAGNYNTVHESFVLDIGMSDEEHAMAGKDMVVRKSKKDKVIRADVQLKLEALKREPGFRAGGIVSHKNRAVSIRDDSSQSARVDRTETRDIRGEGEWQKTAKHNEQIQILADAAKSLDILHANGLVHRDIKPDNLIAITEEDKPHVRRGAIIDWDMVDKAGPNKRSGSPIYMDALAFGSSTPVQQEDKIVQSESGKKYIKRKDYSLELIESSIVTPLTDIYALAQSVIVLNKMAAASKNKFYSGIKIDDFFPLYNTACDLVDSGYQQGIAYIVRNNSSDYMEIAKRIRNNPNGRYQKFLEALKQYNSKLNPATNLMTSPK